MTLSLFIDAVCGGLTFLALNLLVAWAALLGGWRLLPKAPASARLAAAAVLAIALIVVTVQLLGTAGLYGRPGVAVVVVAVAWVAHRAWAGRASVEDDLRAVRDAVVSVATSAGAPLLWLALGAWLLAAWKAVTRLPLGWDAFTYHLPFAAAFVQTGRLSTIDGPLSMDHYAHFPKNAEMFASWFLLPVHGDLLVGLMNVWLIAVAWLATYALMRTLDVSGADSALASTAVATSPFLYSFATSENTDLFVFALLTAAVLFLVRSLQTHEWADALLTVAATGLALGAKYSALPLGGLILVVLLLSALQRATRWATRGGLATQLAVGALVLLACGGRQYVLNAAATSNPIYPLTFVVNGNELLPGSPYTTWLTEQLGTGTRTDDRFQFSGMFHYYPAWKTPTSAGPKYLGILPLALLAGLLARGRRSKEIRLVLVLTVVAFAFAQLPTTGLPALSRRFWPGSASRLIGIAFGLFAVVASTLLARLRPWQATALRLLTAAFILWDLALADAALVSVAHVGALLLSGLLIGMTVMLASRPLARRTAALASLAAVLVALLGVAALAARRETTTWTDVVATSEVDTAPMAAAPAWALVDRGRPLRLALAADDDLRGQNRFLYPLLGRHLQNTVSYVPVNAAVSPQSPEYIRQEQPREDDWLRGLEARHIEMVVVQAPWPIEDAWMRGQAARFALVLDAAAVRVYEVRR